MRQAAAQSCRKEMQEQFLHLFFVSKVFPTITDKSYMGEELTDADLSDIESEKSWRIIARQDVAQDRAKESAMELLSPQDAISGFFEVKKNIVFCNEKQMDARDAAKRAYVNDLVRRGFSEQQAWSEADRFTSGR